MATPLKRTAEGAVVLPASAYGQYVSTVQGWQHKQAKARGLFEQLVARKSIKAGISPAAARKRGERWLARLLRYRTINSAGLFACLEPDECDKVIAACLPYALKANAANDPAECVYIIGPIDRGPYKIGVSASPQARLGALQTASPVPLSLHAVFDVMSGQSFYVEKEAHRILYAHRMSGEWFNVNLSTAVTAVTKALDSIYVKRKKPA